MEETPTEQAAVDYAPEMGGTHPYDAGRKAAMLVNNRLAEALRLIANLPADHCPGDCMEDAYAHLRALAREALNACSLPL